MFHFCNLARPSWNVPIPLWQEVDALHRTTSQPPTSTTNFNLTPTFSPSIALMDVQCPIYLTLMAVSVWLLGESSEGGGEEKKSGSGPKKPETVNEISKMLQHVRSFWWLYYILSIAVKMCKIGLCTGVAAWLRDPFSFVLPISLCKRLDACGSSLAPPPCSHSHEIGSAGEARWYGLCHVWICTGADKRRRRSRIKRIWRRCGEIFVGFYVSHVAARLRGETRVTAVRQCNRWTAVPVLSLSITVNHFMMVTQCNYVSRLTEGIQVTSCCVRCCSQFQSTFFSWSR